MNRMMQLIVTLFLLLSACATVQTEKEYIYFPFEDGWKIGDHAEFRRQGYITQFIPERDDIKNWKELLTVHNFVPPRGGRSPQDTINALKVIMERDCPGASKWNIIDKDETSILYEWQVKPCLGRAEQHEIARIIYGKYDRWHLRYSVKGYQMPPEQRDEWIERLSDADIVTSVP